MRRGESSCNGHELRSRALQRDDSNGDETVLSFVLSPVVAAGNPLPRDPRAGAAVLQAAAREAAVGSEFPTAAMCDALGGLQLR